MNPPIPAQFLALLAAFMFAMGNVSARYGLRTSTPITGTLTLAWVTLLVFAPIAWVASSRADIKIGGLLAFFAAGFASPGLARTLLFMSFRRIGLSRSITIVNSAPLITVIIAVIALGERPTFLVYLGTLLIVGGVISLTYEQRSASRTEGHGKPVWYYFIYAVTAAFILGVSVALRKVGVTIIPTLSLGLCIAALGTLLAIGLWYPFLPQEDRFQLSRKNIGFFLGGGLLTNLGMLSYFAALQRGPVSTVTPLASTVPLFTLAFSWVLFREVERLNFRIAAGAFLVCAGAALVTLSRV
jgi:drug/metabolite transporter (DMT)-like permease